MRRRLHRDHRHLWKLPFLLVGRVLLLYGWVLVWTTLWCWEACGPAGVRAARTTSRIFGWPR